ncbi:hypothetical protein ABBQ38_010766 [Trebouxia sp. C0009 RCD-2024]
MVSGSCNIRAKQAELQATYRKQRLIQVRCQDKQHAEFKRQQYKENCQQFASFEQVSSGQEWQHQSSAALVELQQQLSANLAKTGQGQKAAHAANQTAAVLAAHRTAERAAQLQLAKQRFAHALQLKHSEQSAAVAGSVNRLQRISNTMAAESTRAHALAQHHRAIQAEAAANGLLPAATNWSESALRSIDYNHTRLHELGTTVPRTVLVERNGDRGKTQCNEAAETAVQLQARMAEEQERRRKVAADQQAATTARGKAAAEHSRLHSNARHTQAQLAAAQHAQRAQQIKGLSADRPGPLGMRCNTMHSQQQLQRQFEAQFLHKPPDLKAKLKAQLLQQTQQQLQRQAAGQEAALQWTNCMPAVQQQKPPLGRLAG